MSDTNPPSAGDKFNQLVEIMARLRGPRGCPWDREQSFLTLRKYLIEETYEVLDAIDRDDFEHLVEELGDLLLQPVFLAQMASEENRFSIANCLDAIIGKLIRRHPHVFGDAHARTADDVKLRWDEIKAREKLDKGKAPEHMLDAVPRAQPALVEAQDIGSKVSKAGFDWPDAGSVLDKVHEELRELDTARRRERPDRAEIEEEFGDLLFAAVNLARKLNVDAELALRGANAKFRKRFNYVEESLAARGRPLGQATLDEMEAEWQQAKRAPR